MCNACGNQCCGSDAFEGCGCDCSHDGCAASCDLCGHPEDECACGWDAGEDDWDW